MTAQTWPQRLRELDDVIEKHADAGTELLRKRTNPKEVIGEIEFLHILLRRRDCILAECRRQTGMTEGDLMRSQDYMLRKTC